MYRSRCCVVLALLLLQGTNGRGDDGVENENVHRLLKLAAQSERTLLVRAAALNTLAQIHPRDTATQQAMLDGLKQLLNRSAEGRVQADLLPYVLQAIGSLGSPARGTVPALVELKGISRPLDDAIDNALACLLAASQATPDLPGDFVAMKKSKTYIADLTKMLKDTGNDVSVRLLAAKALGMAGKDANSAYDAIATIAKDSTDPDLQAVAARALTTIRPKVEKP
jgi:hypothetical protein